MIGGTWLHWCTFQLNYLIKQFIGNSFILSYNAHSLCFTRQHFLVVPTTALGPPSYQSQPSPFDSTFSQNSPFFWSILSKCQQVAAHVSYVGLGQNCSAGVVLWIFAVYPLCVQRSEIALQRCMNCGTKYESYIAYIEKPLVWLASPSYK